MAFCLRKFLRTCRSRCPGRPSRRGSRMSWKVRPLTLMTSKQYKVAQQDGETEGQFMARLGVLSAPDITGAVGKVQDKLLEKQRKLQDNLTEAQQRLNIAQMQARSSGTTEGVQAVETVIGLLMRRRRSISAITRSHGAAQRQREQANDLKQEGQ